MIINNLFSTPLALIDYPEHNNIKDILVNHCFSIKLNTKTGGKNWISKNLYNTCDIYDIFEDNTFQQLNNWVTEKANEFKKHLGQSKNIKQSKAWFNIYNKNSFQEFHNHNFNYISCIYYLKANKEDAKTIFKSPLIENIYDPELDSKNPYTWKTFKIDPLEGRLVLFKSSLEHCVESQNIENPRITLAYNYKI